MSALPQIREQLLDGVFTLDCPRFFDTRGSFTKLFHRPTFDCLGLSFSAAEIFTSTSTIGVLRGLHFQTGKAAHEKLIYCSKGRVLDVVVDIRPDSKYFNKPVSIELDERTPIALFVGKGYAHGFLTLSNESTLLYSTSTIHHPDLDCGVLWSSIDFEWPARNPLLSSRDRQHPPIIDLL